MPVTGRGVGGAGAGAGVFGAVPVRLTTAAADTTTLTNTSRGAYLNALPPALAALQTGLAFFAVVVIVRYCASKAYLCLRRRRGADRRTAAYGPQDYPYRQRQRQRQHREYSWDSQPAWIMDDEKNFLHGPPKYADDSVAVAADGEAVALARKATTALSVDPLWKKTAALSNYDALPRTVLSRPPPAPPLTPPELSSAVFTFQPQSTSVDDNFMNQPNPDYTSSTSGSALPAASDSSPSIPRRRSYNKTLPIGVPAPVSQASSGLSDSSQFSPFSPSSFPPTSPLLPPAPPSEGSATEIDVKGEIVGVMSGDGAGWTRHTRVYGGGVCLACAASGGNHEGGFYGATVPPEEMR